MNKRNKEQFPSEKDLEQNTLNQTKQDKEETISDEELVVEPENVDVNQQVDDLLQEIADLKQQNSDLDDRFLRNQAEIQNMQARQKKELATSLKYASQSFAKNLLPAIDNLERALEIEVDDEASQQLKKGVQMTLDSIVGSFKEEGIMEINPLNEEFDPNQEQAVQTIPADDDHPANTVVQVLQKGYLYKERVIRPAMVVVAQ